MRKRKPSPQELKLEARIEKEQRAFEKWYSRLRRAMSGLEKSRRTVVRCRRRLDKLATEPPTEGGDRVP